MEKKNITFQKSVKKRTIVKRIELSNTVKYTIQGLIIKKNEEMLGKSDIEKVKRSQLSP
jgi:hypothetical protein